eukprot:1391916-Amorphochlora_amoeboformis.AAC.3
MKYNVPELEWRLHNMDETLKPISTTKLPIYHFNGHHIISTDAPKQRVPKRWFVVHTRIVIDDF